MARITASTYHTCQVTDDGTARCWGLNEFGQLGDGTTANRPTPVTVSGLTNAVAIAAGFGYTCALLATGTVSCWGTNTSGELGVGPLSISGPPVASAGPAIPAIHPDLNVERKPSLDARMHPTQRRNHDQLALATTAVKRMLTALIQKLNAVS